MQDRNLSVHHAVAGVLWLISASLIVIGIIISTPGVGQLGLMCAGAAMIANTRGFFCKASERQRRLVEAVLERSRGDVRSLH